MYSAVVTTYPSPGRYTFQLRVSGDNSSLVPEIGSIPDAASSGGRSVRFAAEKLVPAGEFIRTVRGPVVHIHRLPDLQRSPPGKITDLKVETGADGALYSSWTSSGGDYSSGSASGYKFVYSDDISVLLDPLQEPTELISVDKTVATGVVSTAELYFPFYDRDYYLGLVPVDSDGNRGPVSNLVHVYLPAPAEQTPEPDPTSPVPTLSLLNSEKDWIMVGVICGILLVLIVISVVSISYFCCISKRRTAADRKVSTGSVSDVNVASSGSSDHTDGTDAGSFDSDLKNLSGTNLAPGYPDPRDLEFGPPPFPRHAELETPTKEAAGASTRATPVYWSASQLLSKLEDGGYPQEYSVFQQEYSGYHYGGGSREPPRSPLEVSTADYTDHRAVIPDEFCVTVSDLPRRYGEDHPVLPADTPVRDTVRHPADPFRHSHRSREKMPPPLYPKPKNITQV